MLRNEMFSWNTDVNDTSDPDFLGWLERHDIVMEINCGEGTYFANCTFTARGAACLHNLIRTWFNSGVESELATEFAKIKPALLHSI